MSEFKQGIFNILKLFGTQFSIGFNLYLGYIIIAMFVVSVMTGASPREAGSCTYRPILMVFVPFCTNYGVTAYPGEDSMTKNPIN